jgi:serine/threonine protein kinase
MSEKRETTEARAPGAIVRTKECEFRLVSKARAGGFGEVWMAELALRPPLPGPDRFAIKFATSELGERSLRAEAELAPRLARLAGVVKILELVGGEPAFAVMAWGGDRTLRDVLDAARSPDERARAARLVLKVVETVAAVHRLSIVHGDLKPENVLVDEHDVPRLIDFGLARVLRSTRLESKLSDSLASKDLAGGTLAYLPPEARKGAEPTFQGDIYALGVLLHELLLGRRPDKATELESLAPSVPEGALDVLRRALAYEPGDRYRSAGALEADLTRIEGALTANGARRRFRVVARWALGGLAAFFVALRYVSVAALLALYAGILVSCFLVETPAPLLGFLPLLLLHGVIRWEGPESPQEAALRRKGQVVGREPAKPELRRRR